jgi:hypothetical protein
MRPGPLGPGMVAAGAPLCLSCRRAGLRVPASRVCCASAAQGCDRRGAPQSAPAGARALRPAPALCRGADARPKRSGPGGAAARRSDRCATMGGTCGLAGPKPSRTETAGPRTALTEGAGGPERRITQGSWPSRHGRNRYTPGVDICQSHCPWARVEANIGGTGQDLGARPPGNAPAGAPSQIGPKGRARRGR